MQMAFYASVFVSSVLLLASNNIWMHPKGTHPDVNREFLTANLGHHGTR